MSLNMNVKRKNDYISVDSSNSASYDNMKFIRELEAMSNKSEDQSFNEYGRKTAKQLDYYLENYTTPEWPNYFGPLAPVIDFGRNYATMWWKNLDPSDKFFHCKANYEAASRDSFKYNDAIAKQLSDLREYFDQKVKGDTPEMSFADQQANFRGRYGAKMGKTLQESCPTYYKDYETW